MPLSRTVLPSADVENKSTTYVCTSLCSLAAAGSLKFLSLKTSPEQNSSAWETRPALQATDKSAADHGRTRRASSQSRPLFHCGGQRGRPATVCDAEDLQAPGNDVASKRSPPRWSHVAHEAPNGRVDEDTQN